MPGSDEALYRLSGGLALEKSVAEIRREISSWDVPALVTYRDSLKPRGFLDFLAFIDDTKRQAGYLASHAELLERFPGMEVDFTW